MQPIVPPAAPLPVSSIGGNQRSLKVAWFSFFPIEWIDGVPEWVNRLPKGHPATWQQSLLAELERDPRVQLHIIVLRKQFAADATFERNGVTFRLLKMPGGLRAPSLFWLDTWRIGRCLRGIQPDVVHAWGTEQGAALAARRLRYPYVISIQGLMGWFRTLIPLNRFERLAVSLERWSLRGAQLVSAESTDTSARVRQAYPGVRVLHIEHPPMHHFFKVVRRPEAGRLTFLSVGTMGFRKGSDLYLEALAQLGKEVDFRCIAVGHPNEPFLVPLRAKLPSWLWDRVEFKSGLSEDQISAEYGAATLMVMPTRADTGPVAVKEAVVAGLPVVASELGGVPDYIVPGRNGLICEPDNLGSLVKALHAACRDEGFRNGRVDPEVLAAKRRELNPAHAANQFVEAYKRAVRDQRPNR